jgi:hypothetical protein
MDNQQIVQIPANRLPLCWPDRVAYFERHNELLNSTEFNGYAAWQMLEQEYYTFFKCNRYESYESFKRCRAHFHNTRAAKRSSQPKHQ